MLVFPLAAQAKTKTVNIGAPKSVQKKLPNTADVNDFFPHGVTIHAGDKVKFKPVGGFHTVDLPKSGQSTLPIITPDGKKVSGVLDAAGAPFWFNGKDELSFNPALGKGIYGKNVTYNGKKRVESGAPLGNKLKPFTVKFPKTGSYTYFCDIHPGMKGVVRVVSKDRRIPSAQADKQRLDRQIQRDVKTAKSLAATKPPSGIVDVGVRGSGNVELYVMAPDKLTVPIGTTLRFRMSPRSTEFHTATFGPGDPEKDPSSYLGQIAASFQGNGPFDARAMYPSEQPPAIGSLTPVLHGNGFWNTGWMDRSGAYPTSGSVTFSAAGTYQYYCMIHPFMHGTITVQ